jgi:uncharacterized protein (TIGR02452 family)
VPVFRADEGALLYQPCTVSFLTAAAPTLGAIAANQPAAAGTVPGVLATRATRVLAVAAAVPPGRTVSDGVTRVGKFPGQVLQAGCAL